MLTYKLTTIYRNN